MIFLLLQLMGLENVPQLMGLENVLKGGCGRNMETFFNGTFK